MSGLLIGTSGGGGNRPGAGGGIGRRAAPGSPSPIGHGRGRRRRRRRRSAAACPGPAGPPAGSAGGAVGDSDGGAAWITGMPTSVGGTSAATGQLPRIRASYTAGSGRSRNSSAFCRSRMCSTARTCTHCGSAPFGDRNVVVRQDRPLGELEARQGGVVVDDGRVFAGQRVGPVPLGLEQDVDRALRRAGLERLEPGVQAGWRWPAAGRAGPAFAGSTG